MINFKTNLVANAGNKVHLAFLLVLMSYSVCGQSCDCPASDSCGPCSGGLSSLTLRYSGVGLVINVLASDSEGRVGISILNNTITLESEAPGIPFNGNVTLTAIVLLRPGTIFESEVIDVSCSSPINIGDTYGNFSILAGVSVAGLAICCTASEIEANPPEISNCPTDIYVAASSTSCDAVVNWEEPLAVDDCELLNFTSTVSPGSSFPLGTTEVTYTAVDKFENTATCTFFVVVADETPPTFQGCHSYILGYTSGQACTGAAFWTVPTAVDNCSAVQITGNYSSGSIFPFGETTVAYTASDEAGNTVVCSFIVQVKDTLDPVFSNCRVSDVVVSSTNSCEAVASWSPPEATDDCSVSTTSNYNPGDIFPLGVTPVIYTAVDASGNTAICTFDVVVVDTDPPNFPECPTDIVVTANSTCSAEVHWNVPIAEDACSGVVASTASHEPGSIFPVGITRISYTATDEAGNAGSCYFDVIVQNELAPVISGCPGDISMKAGESGQVEVYWEEPVAEVSCGTVMLQSSHHPGESFPVGITEVEYSATDDTGRISSCYFNVSVSYEEVKFDVAPVVTPDGDGKNDLWLLSNIEKFRNNQVIIVDRWGSEIYHATGYDNEDIVWDGNNMNGAPVPTGTYFYFISVKFVSEKVEKKGFIELVR